MTSFWVSGMPKPQPRPRFSRRSGRVYNPGTADGWKEAVMWSARAAGVNKPFEGPVELRIDFQMGNSDRCSKPDLDNLIKSSMDALTEIGAWKDDSQVCDLRCSKNTGMPGAHFVIREIRE